MSENYNGQVAPSGFKYNNDIPMANPAPNQGSQGESSNKRIGICLIAVLVVVVVVIVAVVATRGDSDNVTPGDTNIKAAEIIRSDNDYIGLAFFTDMGSVERAAFENAQAKWSGIVGETLGQWEFNQEFNAGDDLCGAAFAGEDLNFKFLLILAGIQDIDGPLGILGGAAPCFAIFQNDDRFLPSLGVMIFDKADIKLMKDDGTLVSVILHEMGHVLGIGSLWADARIDLLRNPVATANSNQQPIFIGSQAITQFDISNDGVDDNDFSSVPVENGFTNGRFNGAGEGSLNVHWDEDGTPGELMVFAISSGATPPLSAITIGALEDAGYIVDLTKADAFSTSAARAEQKKLRGEGAKVYDLSKDILDIPIRVYEGH